MEQFIFFDESMRAGAPVPMLTINTVGPTIMQFGTDEQKDFFLPKILRGRDPLLHRLQRAGRGHRPGRAAHGGGARRRRVRDQRPEDVDELRQQRGLLLAGRAHQHRGQEAQGHVDDHRADGHARHRGAAAAPDGRARDRRRALRRRAGAGRQPGRRREQRLDADHQPAQPRAGDAVQPGHGRPGADRGPPVGPGHAACPTGGASSTRSGCSTTWPGPTPGSSSCASSTGRWRGRPRTRSSRWPTPARTKVYGTELYLDTIGLAVRDRR